MTKMPNATTFFVTKSRQITAHDGVKVRIGAAHEEARATEPT